MIAGALASHSVTVLADHVEASAGMGGGVQLAVTDKQGGSRVECAGRSQSRTAFDVADRRPLVCTSTLRAVSAAHGGRHPNRGPNPAIAGRIWDPRKNPTRHISGLHRQPSFPVGESRQTSTSSSWQPGCQGATSPGPLRCNRQDGQNRRIRLYQTSFGPQSSLPLPVFPHTTKGKLGANKQSSGGAHLALTERLNQIIHSRTP